MASTFTEPPLALQPSVQELAQAMRAGVENRRMRGVLPPSFSPSARFSAETRNALERHLDLLAFPPIAKPGPMARPMKFLRRIWKGLIRPWLGVQTEFNRLTLEVLQGLQHEMHAIHRRIDECNELIEKCYPAAVNCELSHHGKIAKAGLWFNPPIVVELQNDRPVLAAVSERIVEHIFVHTRLPKPPARILDLGCAESTTAVEMASFGYQVDGIDLRSMSVYHPQFTMTQADVCKLPFDDETFDAVVSLSTVEHVGLDWYTPVAQDASDHRAAAEAHRVLIKGGRFILTVPFGQRATTQVHRVYDPSALEALLQPFHIEEILYGVRDGETWSVTADVSRAARMESAQRVSAVALVVATRA
jgi:SAM-dependent methyltransferase